MKIASETKKLQMSLILSFYQSLSGPSGVWATTFYWAIEFLFLPYRPQITASTKDGMPNKCTRSFCILQWYIFSFLLFYISFMVCHKIYHVCMYVNEIKRKILFFMDSWSNRNQLDWFKFNMKKVFGNV